MGEINLPTEQISILNIDLIDDSKFQERLFFSRIDGETKIEDSTLMSLKESIAENGLLQPLIVRKNEDKYEIIDGHRRFAAIKLLGMHEVKVIIKEIDEDDAHIHAIIMNLQRKNLTIFELACAYQKLLTSGKFKDQRELAQKLGKDETYVGDIIKTLDMDKRIVEDLKTAQSVKDSKALRLIRKLEGVNNDGFSELQWTAYLELKSGVIDRNGLQEKVRLGRSAQNVVVAKVSKNSLNLNLKFDSLADNQKHELLLSLQSKLSEYGLNCTLVLPD